MTESRPGDASLRDALVALVVIALFSALTLAFELAERFNQWVARFEGIQLDELVLDAFLVSAVVAWFALRRMAELRVAAGEREAARRRLADLVAENRQLARHTLEVQESERRALAHEIHDDIGQYLTAIRLGAAVLKHHTDPSVREAVGRIEVNATHVQDRLREQLRRLRPVILDTDGVQDALAMLIAHWQTENPEVAYTVDIAPGIPVLGDEMNTAIFRIVQEALTNAARHAAARHVRTSLSCDASVLHLRISDDGRGARSNPNGGGFGLIGMRERAHALGGTVTFERPEAGGFAVEVSLPLVTAMQGTASTARTGNTAAHAGQEP